MDAKQLRSRGLDLAKGIAIFFMIYGHCIQVMVPIGIDFHDNFMFKIIYSFHMPLFMVISGYLFEKTVAKYDFKDIIIKKTKTLLVPAIFFGIIIGCFQIVINDYSNIISSMFYGLTSLWFVLAVFISSCLFAFVKNFLKDSNIVYIILVILCFFIPIAGPYLFMFQFFFLGYMYSKYKLNFINKKRCLVFITCLISFIILIPFFNRNTYVDVSGMNILNNDYSCMPLLVLYRTVIAIIGCAMTISFCKLIENKFSDKKIFDVVCNLGKNTMYIYIISIFLLSYGYKLLHLNIDIDNQIVYTLLYALPWAIIYIIVIYKLNELLLKNRLWRMIFNLSKNKISMGGGTTNEQ